MIPIQCEFMDISVGFASGWGNVQHCSTSSVRVLEEMNKLFPTEALLWGLLHIGYELSITAEK